MEYAGRPAELPYHIIVPSLVDFGFSSPPPLDLDATYVEQARIFKLMMSALGSGKDGSGGFMVYSGDVESPIATAMVALYDEVEALYLTKWSGNFWSTGTGYARIYANRPCTVDLAIGSSPIAFIA
ncbi:hypothetical protein B0J12DRAFT_772889 [Macrophomina phaseolina]|uniref:Uncharacterized protein n=1 Tax=Macrophomina phaseolina TaxID=35725 RepID=A0ABQ8GKU2_9PEZI|nr:hypothetical protein B0J12DRAFT_772889 [Macrophomina phaseolina]